jgi:hypothetical protein
MWADILIPSPAWNQLNDAYGFALTTLSMAPCRRSSHAREVIFLTRPGRKGTASTPNRTSRTVATRREAACAADATRFEKPMIWTKVPCSLRSSLIGDHEPKQKNGEADERPGDRRDHLKLQQLGICRHGEPI